jgi:uroporphyrinogen-III synthase
LIDAVTFFSSAMIISFMHTAKETRELGKLNYKEYFHTLKSGLVYIKENEIIFNFVLLAMVANAILEHNKVTYHNFSCVLFLSS